ncbi:MAG: hypothetical protein U1F57_02605 [bacterium]
MADTVINDTSAPQIDAREFARSGERGAISTGPGKFAQLVDGLLPVAQTANQLWGKPVIAAAMTVLPGSGGQMAGASSPMGGGVFGSGGGGVFGRSSITGPGGSTGGGGGVPFGPPPAPPSVGGGSSVSSAGGIPGMGGGADYQTQLDSMFNNNMMFLMLQTKVQNMSQQIQLTSNTIKAKDDAIANTIRNFRS